MGGNSSAWIPTPNSKKPSRNSAPTRSRIATKLLRMAQNKPRPIACSATGSRRGAALPFGCRRKFEERTPSGLENAVPIKIVGPGFVQVVRRKQPAVVAQFVDRGFARIVPRMHADVVGEPSTLQKIARRARGHHVVPRRSSTAGARDEVVEREILVRATILALETVAEKHVEPGEGWMTRRPHVTLERNDRRQLHL